MVARAQRVAHREPRGHRGGRPRHHRRVDSDQRRDRRRQDDARRGPRPGRRWAGGPDHRPPGCRRSARRRAVRRATTARSCSVASFPPTVGPAPTSTAVRQRLRHSPRQRSTSSTSTASMPTRGCCRRLSQRVALDAFGGIDLTRLREARARVAELDAELATLGGDERARARELDLARFQLTELDAAAHRGSGRGRGARSARRHLGERR